MGGDFQQYRANVGCGRSGCLYTASLGIYWSFITFLKYKIVQNWIVKQQQGRCRTRRRISIVWNAISSAQTPTRWWLTGGSTRKRTRFSPPDSKSSLRRKTVASTAARTPTSKRTTTASSVATPFSAWLKCQLTSTAISNRRLRESHSAVNWNNMPYN